MNPRRYWQGMDFRRQIFVFIVATVCATIVLAEFLLEPLVEYVLRLFSGGQERSWHEMVVWATSLVGPALFSGWWMTRAIGRRLTPLAMATRRFALGDLSARVVVGHGREDVFDGVGRQFNALADSQQRLLRHERRMLVDISHELRSPLARIEMALALLDDDDPAERELARRRIGEETGNMTGLVGLLMARGRERVACEEKRAVEVDVMLVAALDAYRRNATARQTEIRDRIKPGLAVTANPAAFRRVVDNLMENALFYGNGAPVELILSAEGDTVRLRVRDHGPGVPEDQLEAIFRPFHRVDPSRDRESGGAGLGLALVQEAVIDMGGRVTAVNAHPGLLVEIELPRAPDPCPTA